jgi:hypothetical protein
MDNESIVVNSALTSYGVVDRGVKVGFPEWPKHFSIL